MGRGAWLIVKSNIEISKGIHRMILDSKDISKEAKAGQFIHLLCPGEFGALLRRPLSISSIDGRKDECTLIYRVQGKGTKGLSTMSKGDRIHGIGPLGKGFMLDPALRKVAVVAGGMGTAPIIEVIKFYKDRSKVYLGFLDRPILLHEIDKYSQNIKVYTESGGFGTKGLVTWGLMEEWQKEPPEMVFCCGPRPMMREVSKLCSQLKIPCQVSMEERMACGIGACLVCSCKTKKDGQKNGYTRVCKDGPVYWGEEVDWDD